MDMGIGCQGTRQRDKVAMQGHVWDHIKDTWKSQCTYKMKGKAVLKYCSLLIGFWNLHLTLIELTGEYASLQQPSPQVRQQEKRMFVIADLRTHHKDLGLSWWIPCNGDLKIWFVPITSHAAQWSSHFQETMNMLTLISCWQLLDF